MTTRETQMSDHVDDEKLQRYFDGETSPGETTLVRRHLAECRVCARSLASLERLHALFADAADADVDAAAPELEAMFEKVRAGIEKQGKAGFGERLRVLVSETVEHKKHVWIPALTMAAAAVVALAVLVGKGGPVEAPPGAMALRTGQEPVQAVADARGSEVLSADFAAGAAGTVFTLEGTAGEAPVAVVWITDEAPVQAP
jgi:anti-sigma factor RsiW